MVIYNTAPRQKDIQRERERDALVLEGGVRRDWALGEPRDAVHIWCSSLVEPVPVDGRTFTILQTVGHPHFNVVTFTRLNEISEIVVVVAVDIMVVVVLLLMLSFFAGSLTT